MRTMGRNSRFVVILLLLSVGLWFVFQGGGESRPNPDAGYRPTDATLEAIEFGKQGEFRKAFQIIKDEAYSGDRFAQFALGDMYDRGEGVEQDMDKAIQWYRRSAKQGDIAGMYSLSQVLRKYDAYRDIDESVRWLKAGARKEDPRAQNALSKLYFEGDYVEPDYEKAVKWARRAISNEDADAMHSMGLAYVDGQGVDADYERALHYFEMAARHGSRAGLANLDVFNRQSDNVQVSMVEQYRWLWTLQQVDERDDRHRIVAQFENRMFWWQVVWARTMGRLWLLRFKSAFE